MELKRWLMTAAGAAALSCFGLEPFVLDDFEAVTGWASTKKASFKLVEGAAVGKGAMEVTIPNGVVLRKMRLSNKTLDVFDQYEGVSFYAKGDGSDVWVPLVLGNSYGGYSYAYFFPLKNTEWTKYTVHFKDFIPQGMSGFIGDPDGLPPCGLTDISFGCRWEIWFNNDRIPQCTFAVDQLQLEPKVTRDTSVPKPAPLGPALAKLKARQPVVIQCQGDSITAGTSLSDKLTQRYSAVCEVYLRQWLKSDCVTFLNRAVGGARVNDERAWLNRDFAGGIPDIMTLWIGYNDKSGCYTKASYKKNVSDYLDRVCRKTQGKTAIILFTPGPGMGPRFTMMDDFADAIRELAKERELACFDVNALLKPIGKLPFEDYMADTAHPNPLGHRTVAEAFAAYLVKAAGITDPAPQKAEVKAVAGGPREWNYNGDTSKLMLEDPAKIVEEGGRRFLRVTGIGNNKDYPRAWMDAVNVEAGQRYRVAGEFLNQVSRGAAHIYVVEYTQTDAMGPYNQKLTLLLSNPGNDRLWDAVQSKKYVVPEGVKSIRLLVWMTKDALGPISVDNLKLLPEK